MLYGASVRVGLSLAAKVAVVTAAMVGLLVLLVVATAASLVGSAAGDCAPGTSAPPARGAQIGVPDRYLALYVDAGEQYGIPWEVLAGVGRVETDHGRLRAPGVRAGTNFAGAAGPMQFLRPTWSEYGVDGDGDGDRDVYDPADAIPGAANYLRASGAREDVEGALFAYNHADWYVADVLEWAERYGGASQENLARDVPSPCTGTALRIGGGIVDVLRNRSVRLTPEMRADLRAGLIDPRVVATLAAAGEEHVIVVSSLLRPGDSDSNHSAGRAADIASVDGSSCYPARRRSPCGRLAMELGDVNGRMRSTELIFGFDPDGPADPRGFADPIGHNDHIHVGFDA